VKQFANMMVREHGKSEASLDAIRSASGEFPRWRSAKENHRELQARLEKLRGADFDRE